MGHRKAVTYKAGYKVVEAEGHPRAFDVRKQYEHVLILEDYLGRYLNDGENTHHLDLDKSNNNIDNLIVTTRKEHAMLHKQLDLILSELIKEGIIAYDRAKKCYIRA